MSCAAKSTDICMTCKNRKGKGYELDIRRKLCFLGNRLGFEVEDEWTPPKLIKQFSRREKYLPRIDLIWYRKAGSFHEFISQFEDQNVLPAYIDTTKAIVIGFELELSDKPTKYILGDISNLSRICTYGFIVMKNVENMIKRSKKASKTFSELHGSSRVFIINPESLQEIIEKISSQENFKNNLQKTN